MKAAPILCLIFLGGLLSFNPVKAGSRLGDAGHFFVLEPVIYAYNPDGRAFTITVHRHHWTVDWANRGDYQIKVTNPQGVAVAEATIPSGDAQVEITIPEGLPGVYQLNLQRAGYGMTWVECSLEHLVIGCGPWDGVDGIGIHERFYSTLVLHALVPRRWYFYVPEGTETFEVKTTILPFQSHREDYGFTIISPRGQRVAAFFGSRSHQRDLPREGEPIIQTIEVDEGAAGRFWSIWVENGDAHNLADTQIMLRGVPPYLASSPEQWFDPDWGQPASPPIYDDSPIRTRVTGEDCKETSVDKYLWAPVPYLGDEDYNGWRGPQTLYWLNPENRPITLGIGCYLTDTQTAFPVEVTVTPPSGTDDPVMQSTMAHGRSARFDIPARGAGIYKVHVDAERWFPWTEPAMPVVIAGLKEDGGGAAFKLETGTARHWFFKVPEGTPGLDLTVSVKHPDHVLAVEIHAPDRLIERFDVRGDEPQTRKITIPENLSGKIWFIRTAVGSGSRFTTDASGRAPITIEADIVLRGVPGYLSPTWEQWFDPADSS